MLKDLLKEYLGDDAKVEEFLGKMKENKIYTSSEENLDTRYTKLKGEFESSKAEHEKALELIEQMKKDTQGQADLQNKINQYETEINELKAKNVQLARDNAMKVALLGAKAKSSDIDYLMYRIEKSQTELKFDDNGTITNMDNIITDLKKIYPNQFETSEKKVIEENKLPKDEGQGAEITKEQFDKMGYKQKNELFMNNKDLFEKLSKGE